MATAKKTPAKGTAKRKAKGDKDVKFSISLPTTIKKAVDMEAANRGIPAIAIYRDQMRERYSPDRSKQEQNLILREVRTLRREVRRVEFAQRVMVELLVTATKNMVAALPPINADGQKRGEAFYNHLLSTVEKALAGDRGVMDRLPEHLARYDAEAFEEFDDEPTKGGAQ
ncbi:hypothetical protein RKE25_23095 (plasmid) [Dyella sp. BiH032]|uniref:hypothetical protein n=1 Tax=Dyella sp. BiH032 TaxID=3075430 RepID=UPI002892B567|nr:hypothetical protein [Dyella sp. BiH032]WNL48571.1 hypothetical protein RKE25_23095 [Dyella sp. BiH032]